ncbi:MAG: T9SS type A sorting domain-containing protein [Saprospiraceae bacterium]
MRKLFTLIAFIFSTSIIFAQTQTAWNFESGTNAPSGVQAGMTAENATFNVGSTSYVTGYDIGNSPSFLGGLAYASDGWTTNSTHNSGDYFRLRVDAIDDNLDFSNDGLEFKIKRDANGPQKVMVEVIVDGGTFIPLGFPISLSGTNYSTLNINFNSNVAFENTSFLEVRVYGYEAVNATGTLAFDEIAFTLTTVLPVELAYFEGQVENTSTTLDWATYSEENNEYFEVQHSLNGINFETIEIVDGAGTTTDYNEYQFAHENPKTGLNYYRLRQVDFDGQSSYTNIITIEHQSIKVGDIKVFPNPSVDYVNIQLPQNEVSTDVMIYNMNGQVMQTINNLYENNLELNVIDWLSGQYIIIIQQGNQQITRQFIKF